MGCNMYICGYNWGHGLRVCNIGSTGRSRFLSIGNFSKSVIQMVL